MFKRFKNKFLLFLMLVLAILIIDSIFIHTIFPIKKQKILNEINSEVVQSLKLDPPTDQSQ